MNPPDRAMIVLEDIHKSFGSHRILAGLDLAVNRGETFVILGPSGIGKSVTLKHIVGILRPDAGRVILDGEEITRAAKQTLFRIRRRVAYLFQSGALINWLSVGENVELPLAEHTSLGAAEIRSRAMAVLEEVGMERAYGRMPDEISGGMKKRAALARVLVAEPEIILWDEPTAGLDPVMAKSIGRLIRGVQSKRNLTSLVVTHDLDLAFSVADRIGMHCGGRIIAAGTPGEFRASGDPRVSAFLQGEPPGECDPAGEQSGSRRC